MKNNIIENEFAIKTDAENKRKNADSAMKN